MAPWTCPRFTSLKSLLIKSNVFFRFNSSASVTVWPPKWLDIERFLAEWPNGHHSSFLSIIRVTHGNSKQSLSTRHQFKLNETDKVMRFEFGEPYDTSVASNCTDYHNYILHVTLKSFKDGIWRNMIFPLQLFILDKTATSISPVINEALVLKLGKLVTNLWLSYLQSVVILSQILMVET